MSKKNKEMAAVNEEELQEEILPEKKGRKVLNIIINVILVIAIVIAAICTYISFVSTSGNGVPSIFGLEFLSIQTDSMYPTIASGDLIFDVRVDDTGELKAGDVITYWTVINGERVLNTHRIIQIYDGGNYLIFQTKGDNVDIEDPLTVHESEIVGIWTEKKIGGLGKVFDFLQTSTGFLIVVVIPVAIFFLYHLIQFFRVMFEYQSVKNKLAYEQERGKTEDLLDEEKKKMEDLKKAERAKLEEELRQKLKAELLGSGSEEVNPQESSEESDAGDGEPEQENPEQSEEAASKASPPADEPVEDGEAKMRAEIEQKIRAELEAKAAEEAKIAQEKAMREKLEAEIREKVMAEMALKAEEKQDGPKGDSGN